MGFAPSNCPLSAISGQANTFLHLINGSYGLFQVDVPGIKRPTHYHRLYAELFQ